MSSKMFTKAEFEPKLKEIVELDAFKEYVQKASLNGAIRETGFQVMRKKGTNVIPIQIVVSRDFNLYSVYGIEDLNLDRHIGDYKVEDFREKEVIKEEAKSEVKEVKEEVVTKPRRTRKAPAKKVVESEDK